MNNHVACQTQHSGPILQPTSDYPEYEAISASSMHPFATPYKQKDQYMPQPIYSFSYGLKHQLKDQNSDIINIDIKGARDS